MCQATTKNPVLLKPEDKWLDTFDVVSFTEEIKELGAKLKKQQGTKDVTHLNKMIAWSNACGVIGLLTMGFGLNLISIIGLSTWTLTRWTMIAHHVCHGGYDKCHPNKKRWNRFRFAVGTVWRRVCDWLDWMMPEAWNVEHNNRHHYCLSELEDPDLVENNLVDLREADSPMYIKYAQVFGAMLTWKWFYYAPNTYKELKLAKYRKEGKPIPEGVIASDAVTIKVLLQTGTPFYSFWEFMSIVLGPYLVLHFFVTPLPLLVIGYIMNAGPTFYFNAIKNMLVAELLTNAHSFIIVATNHAGNDMYRFREGCRPFTGSFLVRQVIASVDLAYGADLTDFLHGYLNYQIEHHLWPDLSMLSYKKAAPQVKEICARHGIPYIKENVFIRLKKTVDIMVGNTSMRWFPEHYEQKFLEIDESALQAKKNAIKNKGLSSKAIKSTRKIE